MGNCNCFFSLSLLLLYTPVPEGFVLSSRWTAFHHCCQNPLFFLFLVFFCLVHEPLKVDPNSWSDLEVLRLRKCRAKGKGCLTASHESILNISYTRHTTNKKKTKKRALMSSCPVKSSSKKKDVYKRQEKESPREKKWREGDKLRTNQKNHEKTDQKQQEHIRTEDEGTGTGAQDGNRLKSKLN